MTDSMLTVRSPFDGHTIFELGLATREDAEASLVRMVEAHGRGALPIAERVAIVRRVAASVRAKRDVFAERIALEGGKPLVDARVEVDRAASGLEFLAGEGERLAGAAIPMGATAASAGRLAFTIRKPIGPVLAISAFNHPLNLIVHQVGPALIAGCPVLVKPALETPLTCLAFIELLRDAGAPREWVDLLIGNNEITEALVKDPRVAFVSFIGSAAVGWKLRRTIAPGTGIALEHGGTAPVIVDASADVARAAAAIAKGGYYHAGQVCVSVQRVIAHADVVGAVCEALSSEIDRLVVGDPLDAATAVGPLIRARDVGRVDAWVEEARAGGADVVRGGKRLGHQAYAPTLLENVRHDARIVREEVFGPCVVLMTASSLDEAVDLANDARWKFQSAIFTKDVGSAMRAAQRLDAAAVMVNDHTAFRTDWMPFGGRGESGLGVGGHPYSVRELAPETLVVFGQP